MMEESEARDRIDLLEKNMKLCLEDIKSTELQIQALEDLLEYLTSFSDFLTEEWINMAFLSDGELCSSCSSATRAKHHSMCEGLVRLNELNEFKSCMCWCQNSSISFDVETEI